MRCMYSSTAGPHPFSAIAAPARPYSPALRPLLAHPLLAHRGRDSAYMADRPHASKNVACSHVLTHAHSPHALPPALTPTLPPPPPAPSPPACHVPRADAVHVLPAPAPDPAATASCSFAARACCSLRTQYGMG